MDMDDFPRNAGNLCCPFPETTYNWTGGIATWLANRLSLLLDCPAKGYAVFSMAVGTAA